MSFDKFPLDEQRCMFRVGSYSYDSSKMVFIAKSTGYSSKQSNSIALDYEISKINTEIITINLCSIMAVVDAIQPANEFYENFRENLCRQFSYDDRNVVQNISRN